MINNNPVKHSKDQRVCIVGLGYVGLTLAVSMAEVGFTIQGIEVRDEVIENLNLKKAHFFEPGLDNRLARMIDCRRFLYSKDIPKDFNASVYVITVGTPLSENKKSRLDMVENATKQVSEYLKNGDLIIMRSTVKLGVTRRIVIPILNKTGCNFDIAFAPERTLEGNALREIRTLPQIIGGDTYKAAIRASQLFQFLTPTVVRVSDIETAEMIKLVDNAQRDVMFAYSNEIASACDVIGISTAEVIRAGKLGYPRTNLPLPGPVGGPCLEKDSYILAEGLEEKGYKAKITLTARKCNEEQPKYIARYLKNLLVSNNFKKENLIISLLGIAFKGQPITDDLRGTMAKPIHNELRNIFPKSTFRGFDPVVEDKDLIKFGLIPSKNLEECFEDSNIILILNNHPLFSSMPLSKLADLMSNNGIIYDCWNMHDGDNLSLPETIKYIALGSHGKLVDSRYNKKTKL